MRVLHVIPSVAPRDGGPSHAVVAMSAALRAAGTDTLIATTDANGPDSLPVTLGSLTQWMGEPALFFRRRASTGFKYSPALATWLRSHVGEFDVVHIHAVLSHAPLAAASACRAASVPYVVRPLGTMASWSLGRKPLRKRALLALGAARMLREAAALHCTSPAEAVDLEAQGYQPTVVIPLGVDAVGPAPSAEDLARRDADPYLLSMSRLDPKKNLELLITAFAAARSTANRSWRLVIAGEGTREYAGSLMSLAHRVGLSGSIEFQGWVGGEGKASLLGRASLFALPSRHENFGIAVLEAAAHGVPSVLSRGVQLAERLEQSGAAWVADDDHGFEALLAQAMSDTDVRHERSLRAFEASQAFSWNAVAANLNALYARVAGVRA